jgi:hypothetical protein
MSYQRPTEHEQRIIEDFKRDQFLQEQLVALCAEGKRRGLIIQGPPGTGKTTTTTRELKRVTPDFEPVRTKMTPVVAYKTLLKYRRSGLVIDDCDSVLRDPVGVDLLKAATERSGERLLTWKTRGAPFVYPCEYDLTGDELAHCTEVDKKGRVRIDRFRFDGWIIVLTNLNLAKLAQQKPGLGIAALLDRVDHLVQRHWDRDSACLRIEWITIEQGMMANMGLNPLEIDEVLQFIRMNRFKFPELTLRTAEKIAAARRDMPDFWQEYSLRQTDLVVANDVRPPTKRRAA